MMHEGAARDQNKPVAKRANQDTRGNETSRSRDLHFPLFARAEHFGVFRGAGVLISAPTATGKSYIGQHAIRAALGRGDRGTHAYLVPYRALADEVFETFADLASDTGERIRIVTGDHRDPVRPEKADLVVATYESFSSLLRSANFRPGIVVADEVHLVADDTRGPVVEGLFARLLASGRAHSILALSAVVENDEELARWLGVPVLKGTVSDRPVPLELRTQVTTNLDVTVAEVLQECGDGEQALVFCSSRARAEKVARNLAAVSKASVSKSDARALKDLAEAIRREEPDAAGISELLPSGILYHHAGLPKSIRRYIEQAYRERKIRILASTPTLAAGVNLPAGITVVRDITRFETVRGVGRTVVLPSGEVLNMLGRAARPLHVAKGRGIALVERKLRSEPRVTELIDAVKKGHGGVVDSRLPDSFEGLMRFVLAVVVENGETTREEVARVYERTLAYYRCPDKVSFDRAFIDDLMEDIPQYEKVAQSNGSIRLESYRLSPEGVNAQVASGEKGYDVTIGVVQVSCTCPAASRYYRGRICKHQACAIHDLIFGEGVAPEARYRSIYNCGHVFAKTLDIGTRISQSLEILTAWRFLERIPSGWRATSLGEIAAGSTFDLLLAHQAAERIVPASLASYREIAGWAINDYIANADDAVKWQRAVGAWLDETDQRKIRLPVKYRGDFERRLDDFANVCRLYERAAEALGKLDIAAEARRASGAIRYGVAPELVPLMALQFPQLRRGRSRYLFDRGVRNVQDLAVADEKALAGPRAPIALVRQWIDRAQSIQSMRSSASGDVAAVDREFDELVARFRVDPAALAS